MKGQYGYITLKKKKLGLYLMLDIIIALIVFFVGLMLNDFSNKNIFTIIAILFVLPGAKILVSLIVIMPHRSMLREDYERLDRIINKGMVLYDLVLTSTEKVMYIQAFAFMNDKYVLLLKEKQDKKFIENYIKRHMGNYGFDKDVIAITDTEEYFNVLEKLSWDIEPDKEEKKVIMILQI